MLALNLSYLFFFFFPLTIFFGDLKNLDFLLSFPVGFFFLFKKICTSDKYFIL